MCGGRDGGGKTFSNCPLAALLDSEPDAQMVVINDCTLTSGT